MKPLNTRSALWTNGLMLLVAVATTAGAAEPATQPAAAQPIAGVAVLPFEPTGPDAQPWIGQAIQRALLADLSRVRTISPVALDQAKDDAVEQSGARFVISGSYQVIANELRIVGQVTDRADNRAIAGLKATGSLRDLFSLEDQLSAQAARAIQRATGPAVASTEPAEPASIEPRGPLAMRPYDRSTLAESLRTPDRSAADRNRYVYGDYGYGSPYGYSRAYSDPYGYDYADYGYYPQPYYVYPYSNYGSRTIIITPGRSCFPSKGGFNHRRGFSSNPLPLGNVMTPQKAARGVGNVNGFMPMTMKGGLSNTNKAMPMTPKGGMQNVNGTMPMTMRK